MSGKGEKEQVYARYVASGKTQEHLASWGKTLAEVMNPEGKPEVLGEVLVLDVSQENFSGIIAASFLAEFGAEVVKLEPPGGGTPCARSLLTVPMSRELGSPSWWWGGTQRYMTISFRNKN